MKLTPWTLTVATFVLVAGIAVSYFFKPNRMRAPAGFISTTPVYLQSKPFKKPFTKDTAAEAPQTVVAKADVVTSESSQVTTNSELSPVPVPTEPPPLEISLPPSPISMPVTEPKPEAVTVLPQPSAADQPSGFVTQQYRRGERMDVQFKNGQQIATPEVANGSTSGASQRF